MRPPEQQQVPYVQRCPKRRSSDTPVDVTDHAVAITYSKGAPVEREDIDYGQSDHNTVSESGQSFVKINGNWKDMADSDIISAICADLKPNNCCIKALYK